MNAMDEQQASIDRSEWGPGPWDGEPDRDLWVDEAVGYTCLARRADVTGTWCGYVALPVGHPWRELGYEDIPAEVHGGLTYGPAPCQGDICHATNEPDDVRWIGFDCAHAFDAMPAITARTGVEIGGVYRTLDFVRNECASLAAQAKAVG